MFQKTPKGFDKFKRFLGVLWDKEQLPRITKDFKGFKEISSFLKISHRTSKNFRSISRNIEVFYRILKDFGYFYEISKILRDFIKFQENS